MKTKFNIKVDSVTVQVGDTEMVSPAMHIETEAEYTATELKSLWGVVKDISEEAPEVFANLFVNTFKKTLECIEVVENASNNNIELDLN